MKLISLKSKSEFSEVSNLGKKHVTRYFIILAQKPQGLDANSVYIGMKISKKIGNAVTRNKIRRRFKSLLLDFIKKNPTFLSYRFLMIPKRSIALAKYEDLSKELEKALL